MQLFYLYSFGGTGHQVVVLGLLQGPRSHTHTYPTDNQSVNQSVNQSIRNGVNPLLGRTVGIGVDDHVVVGDAGTAHGH